MLRKLVAGVLVAAVQAAAVGAPLVHAHLDNHATDHHGARTVHSHFSGHHSSHPPDIGLRVEDNDAERTVFLQLFVAVGVASFGAYPAVGESFEISVPAEAPPRQLLSVVHGHDPPVAKSGPSRAPPASLS